MGDHVGRRCKRGRSLRISPVSVLPSKVRPCFPCREVIALVNKVMPIYIVFQLFEAICVSTAVPPSPGPLCVALHEEGYLYSECPEYLLIVG